MIPGSFKTSKYSSCTLKNYDYLGSKARILRVCRHQFISTQQVHFLSLMKCVRKLWGGQRGEESIRHSCDLDVSSRRSSYIVCAKAIIILTAIFISGRPSVLTLYLRVTLLLTSLHLITPSLGATVAPASQMKDQGVPSVKCCVHS